MTSGVDAGALGGICSLKGTVFATTPRGIYRWDQGTWAHVRFLGDCKPGVGLDCLVAAGLGGAGVLRGSTAMRVGQSNIRSNAYNEFDYPVTPDDGATLFVRFRTPGVDGNWDDPYKTYVLRLAVNPSKPVSNTNLTLDRASYLGSSGDDYPRAVKINGSGEILAAGDFAEAPGPVVSKLESAGAVAPGCIVRLDGSGRTVLGTALLGNYVTDVAVSDAGPVAASGSFGATLMTGDLKTIVWDDAMAESPVGTLASSRIAIGSDNSVAAVAGNMLYVWKSDGTRVAALNTKHGVAADVEIAANLGMLFVTGHDEGMLDGKALSVAWLEGRTLAAPETVLWRTWGFSPGELRENNASTYGRRISMGPDGYLYCMGVADGRNSIFRWNGMSLGGATALSFDVFNSLWNSDDVRRGYYARLSAVTGEVLAGQFVIPRGRDLTAGNINLWEGDICADSAGNMYVTGICDAGLEGRDTRTLNGAPVGMFKTADPVLLIAAPDFSERRIWTPLTAGAGCTGSPVGVATRFGKTVVLARAESGDMYTTPYAGDTPDIAPDRRGGIDGWFGVLRTGF